MDNEQETIVLGIVGIKNKGEYNSQTKYEKLNVVTYNGSTYCALMDTTGNLPTNTDYWQLYAEKGGTGDTGPQGPKPVKGVDYYTQEDKAEISDEISIDVAEEVSSQIGNLTSATPLAASSTSGMTDTSRIYVNTTDGHWYWYDGTSWVDGGVYQSSGIANDSIITEKINTPILPKFNNLFYDKMQTNNTWGNTITKSNFTVAVAALPFNNDTIQNNYDYIFIYYKVKVTNIISTNGVTVRGGVKMGSSNLSTSINIPNQTVKPADDNKELIIYGVVDMSDKTKPNNIQPIIFTNSGTESSITLQLKECFVCGIKELSSSIMKDLVQRIEKYGPIDGLPSIDLTDNDLERLGNSYFNKKFLQDNVIDVSSLDVNFLNKHDNIFDYIRKSKDESWKEERTFNVSGTLLGNYPFSNYPTDIPFKYLFLSCKIRIVDVSVEGTNNVYITVGARYNNVNHIADHRNPLYLTEDDIGKTFIMPGVITLNDETTEGVTPEFLVSGTGSCTYEIEDIFGCAVSSASTTELSKFNKFIKDYGYSDGIAELIIDNQQKSEINTYYLPQYIKDGIEDKIYDLVQDFNGINFIFQTDFHMNNSPNTIQRSVNSILAANYLCKKLPILAYILGGDYIGNGANTTRKMSIDWMRKLQLNFEYYPNTFMLRGNHDCNPHTSADEKLTDNEIYNCFGKYFDLNNIIRNKSVNTCMYGYQDFEKEKIRLVLVNTSDAYDMGIEYYGAGCINTTQLQWLADNAFDMTGKTDWKLVVVGHYPAISFNDETVPSDETGRLNPLWELLKAVRNGTNLNYTSMGDNFKVIKDFSLQGAIKLAYICGHVHNDRDCLFSNVLQVSVDNISVDDKSDAELGTYDEIVFDIISVDNTNNKLLFTRIGNGSDREFNF